MSEPYTNAPKCAAVLQTGVSVVSCMGMLETAYVGHASRSDERIVDKLSCRSLQARLVVMWPRKRQLCHHGLIRHEERHFGIHARVPIVYALFDIKGLRERARSSNLDL